MFKFLFVLLLACIAIAFIAEYWMWILLALVVLIGTYAFCVKKGYINQQEVVQRIKKKNNSYPEPTDSHYLAYQYEDVKFFPKVEMIAKVNQKNLYSGAEIRLKQEPENEHDNRAVALYISGHQIGYMLRGTLQDMANDYIEKGWPIKATLSSLKFVGGEYQGHFNISYYRESTKTKRLSYHDIDVKAIQPSNPDAIPNTPLRGKNVVFSGIFTLPLNEMMQIAVDAGATLKVRVSKSTDYLVVGEQDPMFLDENGQSSKEATATKLIKQGESHISIINEATFLALAKEATTP